MAILKQVDFEVPNFGEWSSPPAAVPTYRDAVMGLGPIAYWRLGEAFGAVLSDEVGNHPLSLSGGYTLAQPGALTCDTNKSIYFDGGQGSASAAILPAQPNDPFSIAFWVRLPPGPPSGGAIMGQYLNDLPGHTRVHIPGDGRLRFSVFSLFDFYSTQHLGSDWRFVVLTRTSSGMARWWIDGQLDAEQSGAAVSIASLPFVIGKPAFGVVQFYLDELSIFGGDLSEQQIRWLFGLGCCKLALPPGL